MWPTLARRDWSMTARRMPAARSSGFVSGVRRSGVGTAKPGLKVAIVCQGLHVPPEAEVTAPAPTPREAGAPRSGGRRSPDATAVLVSAMAAGVLATALAVTLVAASTSPSEDAERAAFLAAAGASALALLAVVASKRALGRGAAP